MVSGTAGIDPIRDRSGQTDRPGSLGVLIVLPNSIEGVINRLRPFEKDSTTSPGGPSSGEMSFQLGIRSLGEHRQERG